jgi:CheY-like chemotaxis protein
MASILSIGANKKALAQRHRMLREAGFHVVSAGPDESLASLAGDDRFGVAIFGPLVPETERNKTAARLIRACPHIKIIMLYGDMIRKAELADAVLSDRVSPADLAQTVHYLLEKRQLDRRGRGRSA